jgi:hypothetical protein
VHITSRGFGCLVVSLPSPARLRDIFEDASTICFGFGSPSMVPRASQTTSINDLPGRRIRTLDRPGVCLVRPTWVSELSITSR